jgi:hypothetical protein
MENWVILNGVGAVQFGLPAITRNQFSVSSTDLVDMQSLMPADHTLDDEKAGLLNEMLWGAARHNVANHCSAQQCRAQRKQNYEELEEGGENHCHCVPRQGVAANMLPHPNSEGPPMIVPDNPPNIVPNIGPLAAMVTARVLANSEK